MSDPKPLRERAFPAVYALIHRMLVDAGREHGYAMALHGTLARDMDVIAVPWTDEAAAPEVLVAEIIERIGWYDLVEGTQPRPEPEQKPHGRLSWAIQLSGGAYIDLSIFPRTERSAA